MIINIGYHITLLMCSMPNHCLECVFFFFFHHFIFGFVPMGKNRTTARKKTEMKRDCERNRQRERGITRAIEGEGKIYVMKQNEQIAQTPCYIMRFVSYYPHCKWIYCIGLYHTHGFAYFPVILFSCIAIPLSFISQLFVYIYIQI